MTTATLTPALTGLAILCMATLGSVRAAEPFSKKTYTFKTVDGVAIQADVHRAADDKIRPVVVWL